MLPSEGSIWRHEKTGHYYVVLGLCRIEASNEAGVRYKRTLPLPEGLNNPLRLETAHWIRPRAEFLDGRFTEIVELPVVGRDQDLIDDLKETILGLDECLAFWKDAAKKEHSRLREVERQRDTLREDRNALVRQCKRLETDLRLLGRMANAIVAVADNLQDEDDRVYLGSTNDADLLRDVRQEWFEHRFLKNDVGPKRPSAPPDHEPYG